MRRALQAALCAAAALTALGTPAHAQLRSYADPGSVRTIDRGSCDSVALSRDPEAELKAALGAHRRLAAGMIVKFRFGEFMPPATVPGAAPGGAEVAARLRALGGARTAALIYAADPVRQQRCIWLLDAGGLVAHAAAPTDEFVVAGHPGEADAPGAPQAAAAHASGRYLRGFLDGPAPNPAAWRAALAEAARYVLPPALGDVSRYERLLILPIGSLSDFPFAAIDAGGAPLGLKTAIVQLTDVNDLLRVAPFRLADVVSGAALVVGNPRYAPHPAFGAPSDLPRAADEARAVAASFPRASLLLGAEATKPAVLHAAAGASYLHFATHGLADGENPQDGSVLALAGGYITARQIAGLDLRAKRPLVVMSACQTGLGKNFPNGVFGLARSWLYAGAGQVVMSQWNVNDASTGALMTAFARALQSEPRPEYALRRAFLAASGQEGFADPYFWAGFTVFGPPSAALR
ncbi:MAG: CHAT domain-containing protein [Hyphomonadaceae bacterium]